jgi:hypothetical protein
MKITEADLKEFNPWYKDYYTKPVAIAIVKLSKLGLLEQVEGHNKGLSLFPWFVKVKGAGYFCAATKLKAYADEQWVLINN